MTRVPGTTTYPATYEQEAMWTADQLSGGPSRYLESWALRLTGPLDLDAVRWALASLVERHEALRTTLAVEGDEIVQLVPSRWEIALLRRSCRPAERDAELRAIVSEPLRGAPLRATVLDLSPAEFVLVLQVHHAVVDDWAQAIIDQEFQELYAARTEGRPSRLGPAARLGDYAVTQRAAGLAAPVIAYWRDRLRHAPTRNAPPPDRPRPEVPSGLGGQERFAISDETGRQVRQACRASRTTPFTVFAAALTALLCWYTGTAEVIVGTPVSRRGGPDTAPLVGCLTDLLPLRQPARPGDTFATLVTATHQVIWEAIAHKDIPYAQLLAKAAPRKELGGRPLCQTVLVVDDVRQAPLRLPGLTTERLYIPSGAAKFDLCLTIVASHGRYRGFIDYALDLYDQVTVQRVARQFTELLGAATAAPTAPLAGALETLAATVPGE